MDKVLNYYKNNTVEINDKLKKIEKQLEIFSIIRFAIAIIALLSMYYFYKQNNIESFGFIFLVALIIFLVVAFFHNEKINFKNKL